MGLQNSWEVGNLVLNTAGSEVFINCVVLELYLEVKL